MRLSKNWSALVAAYKQAGQGLGRDTIEVTDAIWVERLDDGSVLALGPDTKVNPQHFNLLTLYYSTPEARVKTRRGQLVVPQEARHHKYAHTISTAVVNYTRGPAADQEIAEKVYEFYCMIDRDIVAAVVDRARALVTPSLPPEARRMVRDCRLPPSVGVRPLYLWESHLR